MEARELLQALVYKTDLSMSNIIKELGLNKTTVYKWLKNTSPRYKEDYYKLIKITKEKSLNINKDSRDTKFILDEINKINPDEWKDLMLGLQEKFDLTQFQLLNNIKAKPNFHVSEWINGKRVPSKNIKFKFLEFIKNANLNFEELIKFGKIVRQSIRIDNEWILADKTLRQRHFGRNLLIKKNNKIFINSPLLFPEKRGIHDMEFIAKGNKIIIFYREKRSTRPRPLVLPRLLEINDVFLVGLGIYLGEGARNRHPKITNSEPLIINQGIKFFELFGINKTNLKAWIQLHERSNKLFGEVKDFWTRNTRLNNKNITTIRIKESSGNGNIKDYGTLHLEANSILLQLLIKNLLNLIPRILNQCSLEQIKYFFRGAFAGEGYVGIRKNGSVREVNYCSTRDNERILIKNLLNKFNITSSNEHNRSEIRIYAFNNFKKLIKLNIFKYHIMRGERLVNGFKHLKGNLEKKNDKH